MEICCDILKNSQTPTSFLASSKEISLPFLDHSIQPLFDQSVTTNNIDCKPGSIFPIQQ